MALPQKKRQQKLNVSCGQRILLALGTSFLFGLSFAYESMGPLVWIAFVPLLIAMRAGGRTAAFFLAIGAVLPAHFSFIWWLPAGLAAYSGASPALVQALMAIYCLYAALPYGVAAAIVSPGRRNRKPAGPLAASAGFTLCIHFQPALLPFTPVNCLAAWPLLLQPLSIGGTAFLLMVIFLVNDLAARTLLSASCRYGYRKPLLALALVWIVLLGYGHHMPALMTGALALMIAGRRFSRAGRKKMANHDRK